MCPFSIHYVVKFHQVYEYVPHINFTLLNLIERRKMYFFLFIKKVQLQDANLFPPSLENAKKRNKPRLCACLPILFFGFLHRVHRTKKIVACFVFRVTWWHMLFLQQTQEQFQQGKLQFERREPLITFLIRVLQWYFMGSPRLMTFSHFFSRNMPCQVKMWGRRDTDILGRVHDTLSPAWIS